MKTKLTVILLFTVVCTIAMSSCKKNNIENYSTLKQLYNQYQYGMITEHKLDGETVYSANTNTTDYATYLYDANGEYIINIGYGSDFDDDRLTDTEIIYCCENNIWGKPVVDKYGLAD